MQAKTTSCSAGHFPATRKTTSGGLRQKEQPMKGKKAARRLHLLFLITSKIPPAQKRSSPMAVSQYLRQGSLLDAVRSHLTPDVVRSASSLVGESESSTRQTLNAAAPSILSGVTNMASSREGAGS